MKRGFTLIELLVVIAIIAILAAILFPVFAQAKAAAKRTQDLSNQKQIVTALMLYAGDYDDHSVVAHHELEPDQSPSDLYLWFEPLQPYVKNREVFRDPALKTSPSLFPDFVSPAAFEENRTDYLLNGFFSHGVSMTLFSRPAEQIMIAPRHSQVGFFDYHAWPSAPNGDWERGFIDGSGYVLGDVDSQSQVTDPRNTGRHMGGINVAFADGHAKWFRFSGTLDPTKPADAVDTGGCITSTTSPPSSTITTTKPFCIIQAMVVTFVSDIALIAVISQSRSKLRGVLLGCSAAKESLYTFEPALQ